MLAYPLTGSTAFDDLPAGDLSAVQQGGHGLGLDALQPEGDQRFHGQDLGHLVRRQNRHGGPEAVGLDVLGADLGQLPAAPGVGAELAPLAGAVVALAFCCFLCYGLHGLLGPLQQVLDHQSAVADVIDPGLVDVHLDVAHVVGDAEVVQGAQGVELHLRIVLRADRDADAVLVVDDGHRVALEDDAVAGAEAVRHPGGEVHPLLQQDDRVLALEPLLDIIPVADRALDHFLGEAGIPVRHLREAGIATSGDVLRHLVGQGALPGEGAGLVRVAGSSHGRGRAGQPTVGAGGAQNGVGPALVVDGFTHR